MRVAVQAQVAQRLAAMPVFDDGDFGSGQGLRLRSAGRALQQVGTIDPVGKSICHHVFNLELDQVTLVYHRANIPQVGAAVSPRALSGAGSVRLP
jgi:hypothetical protein